MERLPGWDESFIAFFLHGHSFFPTTTSILRLRPIEVQFPFHNGYFHTPLSCASLRVIRKWKAPSKQRLKGISATACSQKQLAEAGKMYLVQDKLNNVLLKKSPFLCYLLWDLKEQCSGVVLCLWCAVMSFGWHWHFSSTYSSLKIFLQVLWCAVITFIHDLWKMQVQHFCNSVFADLSAVSEGNGQ